MYSYEDRIRAVKLYFKYGGKTATVVRELGYPSGKNLKRWVHIYQALGDLPKRRHPKPRYSWSKSALRWITTSVMAALWLTPAGPSGIRVAKCLAAGLKSCAPVRAAWSRAQTPVDRLRPTRNVRQSLTFAPARHRAGCSKKGWSKRPMLYKWKDQLLGDEAYRSMRKRKLVSPEDEHAAQLERIAQLEQQVRQLQLERDILARAGDLIKDQASTPCP